MKKIAVLVIIFGAICGLLLSLVANRVSTWFNYNTLEIRSPIKIQSIVVITPREKLKPIIKTVYVKEPTCDWSKECVEKYIDFVAKGDIRYSKWAKFAANWEGGYRSQADQENMSDSHSNGDVGSFGQFQFGRGTYFDHCEPNDNWKMDWKAQTRCSKTIWDKGIAHNTWFNTTNKFLSDTGLNSLASN